MGQQHTALSVDSENALVGLPMSRRVHIWGCLKATNILGRMNEEVEDAKLLAAQSADGKKDHRAIA